jgi:hypothetical protein
MKTQISIDHWGGKRLIRQLALLLTLAVAPMLRAQVPDPTGAWLLKSNIQLPTGENLFLLNVFHQGGTLTGDIQGESAFDSHATINPTSGTHPDKTPPPTSNSMASKLPLNVISSPQSGVWQKTGFNTFAATFMVIEYQVQTKPPDVPVFQLTKVQYLNGTLNASGTTMAVHVIVNHYTATGEVIDVIMFDANGLRIPVETQPSTGNLPIPPTPPS